MHMALNLFVTNYGMLQNFDLVYTVIWLGESDTLYAMSWACIFSVKDL